MKRYCRYHGIMCEYATEYGYCQITACVKRGRRAGMSVIIKGDSAFDMHIVSNIKDVETQHIKFQNIYFNCKSIEDAGGTIFVKRKKGKWLLVEESIKVAAYKCSECGRNVWNDMGYDVVKDYPFCHCGADMRGEQE